LQAPAINYHFFQSLGALFAFYTHAMGLDAIVQDIDAEICAWSEFGRCLPATQRP